MINLNHCMLDISKFDYGQTQNIEIKIGRKIYMLDITKNSNNTFVSVYNKVKKERCKYSKYDREAHLISVPVKNDVLLSRGFFEDIEKIQNARNFLLKYTSKIVM